MLDGAGLFCAVLKHLINRNGSCPKVLAATHFHEVFREDMLDPETLPVIFTHMQVMLTSSKGEVLATSSTCAFDEDSAENESIAKAAVSQGESITYLYRWMSHSLL